MVHRARAWLGSTAEEEPYLPATTGQRYRLNPAVTSDWADFQTHARRGITPDNPECLADLDAALALVRGRPFLGIKPSTYAWADPFIQTMISTIVNVAHLASRRHLAAGDPRAALNAATIGLSVDDWAEFLITDGKHAAEELGDTDALDRLAALETQLDDD